MCIVDMFHCVVNAFSAFWLSFKLLKSKQKHMYQSINVAYSVGVSVNKSYNPAHIVGYKLYYQGIRVQKVWPYIIEMICVWIVAVMMYVLKRHLTEIWQALS